MTTLLKSNKLFDSLLLIILMVIQKHFIATISHNQSILNT